MSKSKGNYPDPKILLNKYGADSLRFYLMNSVVMQADNLNFSEKGVESVYRKVELILSNIYKYFATYVGLDNSSKENSNEASAETLDLWIKTRTEELVAEVTKCLDVYDTVHATRTIQEYVDDLSTWYLRRSRKRNDRVFFNTLHDSLLTTSKVIAPFMPFLADDLYRKIKSHGISLDKAESVHLAAWPEVGFSLKEAKRKELAEAMSEVRRLASLGLAKREEVKIRVRQPLSKLTIKRKEALDEGLIEILKDEVNVKEIVFDPNINLPEGEEMQLDVALTPELKEEGIIRETTRLVQGLRRDAGLNPADLMNLYIQCDPATWTVIDSHLSDLRSEVGAKEILSGKSDKATTEKEAELNGSLAWIGLAKI
jgi:isoleucyl-tRNA synthetase